MGLEEPLPIATLKTGYPRRVGRIHYEICFCGLENIRWTRMKLRFSHLPSWEVASFNPVYTRLDKKIGISELYSRMNLEVSQKLESCIQSQILPKANKERPNVAWRMVPPSIDATRLPSIMASSSFRPCEHLTSRASDGCVLFPIRQGPSMVHNLRQ